MKPYAIGMLIGAPIVFAINGFWLGLLSLAITAIVLVAINRYAK